MELNLSLALHKHSLFLRIRALIHPLIPCIHPFPSYPSPPEEKNRGKERSKDYGLASPYGLQPIHPIPPSLVLGSEGGSCKMDRSRLLSSPASPKIRDVRTRLPLRLAVSSIVSPPFQPFLPILPIGWRLSVRTEAQDRMGHASSFTARPDTAHHIGPASGHGA